MSFTIALKAFFKAWKEPEQAKSFLADAPRIEESSQDFSHLRLLAMLQHSGRLIDFFKEDIKDFTDAQIGAAVRQIHEDCNKSLEDLVTIRPLVPEKEGSTITVPKGYDPMAIKVSGKVKGEPPYTGTVIHQGWKAHKKSLPRKIGEQTSEIITPAEIEVRNS
jgi:Domain of unknown function (DUF2760)